MNEDGTLHIYVIATVMRDRTSVQLVYISACEAGMNVDGSMCEILTV